MIQFFYFSFFHEIDITRVLEEGPWKFDQHLLIFHRLEDNEQPTRVPLFLTMIWVHVRDLPLGFMSEKVGVSIGNYIGNFVKSDVHNFDGFWKNYMRIQV